MSEEQLKELQEYNLEYLEAQQSEEIFGGDYTSAVELKYAKKEIERLTKQNKALNEMYELTKKEYIRLNNIINKKEQFLGDNIKRLEREVVKRDNIINELEKFVKNCNEYNSKCNSTIYEARAFEDSVILYKIKELKGSDKE